MNRFVILKHDPGDQLLRTTRAHFDWMFEMDGVLRTFSTDPVHLKNLSGQCETAATELAAHRIQYLEIRGDIGRGLGCVSEVASGSYQIEENTSDLFAVEVTGFYGRSKFRANCIFRRREQKSGALGANTCWDLTIQTSSQGTS